MSSNAEGWLDARGRIARKAFLLRGLPLIVPGTLIYLGIGEAIARWLGTSMFSSDPARALTIARIEGTAGLIVVAALAWPAAALIVRRLHDIGLSGWWLAAMASGEILNSLALAAGLAGTPDALTPLGHAVATLALFGGLSLIPLALWPGQPDANRFGPPPVH